MNVEGQFQLDGEKPILIKRWNVAGTANDFQYGLEWIHLHGGGRRL